MANFTVAPPRLPASSPEHALAASRVAWCDERPTPPTRASASESASGRGAPSAAHAGARTGAGEGPPRAEEAVYDAQDRLRESDGVTYTYTDRGTLYQKGDGSMLETFTYDALGNLTRVERSGFPAIDYVIDAQGRRSAKRVGGSLAKQYVWSGSLRIAAELQGGDLVSRFIYGNGVTTPDLIVRKGTGSTSDRLYRVIADHLGSPIYVVNLADPGDVWLDASYDEWGNVTSFVLDGVDQGSDTSAWPIPQGFAGGLFDADTGLVRFGVRDYDPRVGRWTAKDPILFRGGQGNLYVYVGNDPGNWIDPAGFYGWLLGGGVDVSAGIANVSYSETNFYAYRMSGPSGSVQGPAGSLTTPNIGFGAGLDWGFFTGTGEELANAQDKWTLTIGFWHISIFDGGFTTGPNFGGIVPISVAHEIASDSSFSPYRPAGCP